MKCSPTSASSMAVMPSDQMSILLEYVPPITVSGAMCVGVPMTDSRRAQRGPSTWTTRVSAYGAGGRRSKRLGLRAADTATVVFG